MAISSSGLRASPRERCCCWAVQKAARAGALTPRIFNNWWIKATACCPWRISEPRVFRAGCGLSRWSTSPGRFTGSPRRRRSCRTTMPCWGCLAGQSWHCFWAADILRSERSSPLPPVQSFSPARPRAFGTQCEASIPRGVLGGQEVPFVPIPYSWTSLRGMITGNRTRMFENALQNARAVEAAGIRVETIHGPILLVSFTRDQVWPSTLMSNQLMKRLKDAGFHFRYEHAAFDTTHSNWSIEPCWTNILGFLASTRTPAPLAH